MSTQDIFSPAGSGDLDAVRAWLDRDPGLANVKQVGGEEAGRTPLQVAAMAGHLAVVKLLVERGAEIYAVAQHGYPAVAHAHWEKQPGVVEYFLGEAARHETMLGAPTFGLGIDINLAARLHWTEVVRRHLAVDTLAVHRRGVIGETPLHWAAHNGYLDVVTLLLDAGADVGAEEIGLYGGQPLAWASERQAGIVKLLLARGAEVNARNRRKGSDWEGKTALIVNATQRDDCAEVTELLLAAGADASLRGADGKTALDHATAGGRTRVEAILRRAAT